MLRVGGLLAVLAIGEPAAAGTCVDPVWIEQEASGPAYQGPDFVVDHFKSQYGPVYVYEGCCSQVSSDRKELFLQKDGERVYQTFNADGFSGYLTTRVQKISGSEWHHQAHFFGDGLKGDERDKDFFGRVRLGDAAEQLCKAKPERG